MKANEIRQGNAIQVDGKVYVVVKIDHTKPGKGPAYYQVKLKDVATGLHIDKRYTGGDVVESAPIDRREMEYLFSDQSGATFMDSETYDQVVLPPEVLGDALLYLAPNTSCTVLFYEGNPLSLELPASVELEITDTAPGIKGATATNQLKEATCETGLKTKVPPFITVGEKVRISTEDGRYLARAKE
ncbi:MAG: elongation factor P [Phycisphaerales bacterium]|nr:MAG: elongation factor P [Phycisphaerales bacterium]